MTKPRFHLGGTTKYKYGITTSKKFDKEFQKILKQGKDIQKLSQIVKMLANGKPLDEKYHDHTLRDSKNFKDCREYHIEPDWLLIYQIKDNLLILTLVETGSHADLFNK